jgi:hypothetical protein
LERAEAVGVLTALEMLAEGSAGTDPALSNLHDRLRAALAGLAPTGDGSP